MKYRLIAKSILEYGKRTDSNGNPHQEDAIYPQHGEISDQDRLFILCDGMGGHDAGEVASSTVCSSMALYINSLPTSPDGLFTQKDLEGAVAAAFDALDQKDTGAVKKMGTTMTLLKLHSGGATIAHIGDSRVYHIRPGKDGETTKILFETEDHSLVNQLVKIGELTPEEARTSKQRNIITRAMQPHQERRCKASVTVITDIRKGDYFYLCSDGMLEQEEMDNGTSLRNIFSEKGGDIDNKVKILTGATIENRDNHSAFIVEILDVEGEAEPLIVINNNSAPKATNNNVIQDAVEAKKVETAKKEDKKTLTSLLELSKKYLWVILTIFLILFIIFWIIPHEGENQEKPNNTKQEVEITPTPPVTTDKDQTNNSDPVSHKKEDDTEKEFEVEDQIVQSEDSKNSQQTNGDNLDENKENANVEDQKGVKKDSEDLEEKLKKATSTFENSTKELEGDLQNKDLIGKQ